MNILFKKLHRLVESWGGMLVQVHSNRLDKTSCSCLLSENFSQADFTNEFLCSSFIDKAIVYSSDIKWGNLIHEMGYIFACKEFPHSSEEYDFFGWEYIVAKYIDGPMEEWYNHNSYYEIECLVDTPESNRRYLKRPSGVYDIMPIKDIPRHKVLKSIREQVKFALDNKLAKKQKNNKLIPLAIR